MSLTNDQITAKNFQEFYAQIRPYLNGQVPPVFNKFSKSDLYSTDEQLVGRWINGKPVYQKVVEFSSQKTIGTSWIDVGVNISDGETVVYSCGMYGTENPVSWVSAKITSNKLYVTSAGITSYIDKIIIQYTKTTDSLVSIGNDTDYSTTEKIVGTWIDGKPVYQKTINFTTPSSINTDSKILTISNGETVIDFHGTISRNDGGCMHLGSNYPSQGNSLFFTTNDSKIECYFRVSISTDTSRPAVITLQYTKTTD